MSSAAGAPGQSSGAPESYRPLPPHPDIEYEKKRAKKLLRDAKRGDADALRAMAHVAGDAPPSEYKLALAQLAVAREYGFSSWLKLTQYYESWDRHLRSDRLFATEGMMTHENRVKRILSWHQRRIPLGARTVATFLPRLYGKSVEEVVTSTLSEDEARFIAAREARCSSWEEVVSRAGRRPGHAPSQPRTPFQRASFAVSRGLVADLEEIVAQHPELIHAVEADGGRATLMQRALWREREQRTADARTVTDWVASRGGDLQGELNRALCHLMRSHEDFDYLLERGADPDWLAPNGYSLLEHALFTYNFRGFPKPHLVDQLAKRVKRIPEGFWVAAGLGDVKKTMNYLDKRGAPTAAARRNRPDFGALGPHPLPFNPDATDLEIVWEAYYVAALNLRLPVLAAILDSGFPVDFAPWGSTLLHTSVGLFSPPLIEFLLSRGADPDIIALYNGSPRDFGVSMPDWMAKPAPPDCNRIREIFRALPPKPPGPEKYASMPPKV